ncbi:winged helix DNA-binding protein [Streptomyces sp. NPDC002838]|uniref:LexA family protein n=1 Tax=Streptomyces sp. NPDC002838 TaxID=3154436 RepID=UPI00331FB442
MTPNAPVAAQAHDTPAASLSEGLTSGRSARSAVSLLETPGTTAQTAEHALSTRQTQILAFIGDEIGRRGYAPSLREIGQAVGLSSTSSVAYHVGKLEEAGLLKRDPNIPRTYQVVTGVELPTVASDPQRSMCSVLVPRDGTGEPGTVFVFQVILGPDVGNALRNGALLTVGPIARPGADAPERTDHATILGRVVAVTHPL